MVRLAQTLGRIPATPWRAEASEFNTTRAVTNEPSPREMQKTENQDLAMAVLAQTIGAFTTNLKLLATTALSVQLRGLAVCLRNSSCWLALRASVLRRAVSQTMRPLLHRGASSVSVGRMPLRPAFPVLVRLQVTRQAKRQCSQKVPPFTSTNSA